MQTRMLRSATPSSPAAAAVFAIVAAFHAALVFGQSPEPAKNPPQVFAAWAEQARPWVRSVEKIWDRGYCAFTDLLQVGDRLYCVFREGTGHIPSAEGGDGRIRVLRSTDAAGTSWESIAELAEEGVDLRDPKISRMPDGRLMIVMGGSLYEGTKRLGMMSRVSFSDPAGTTFTAPQPVQIPEEIQTGHDWLWRVTWHEHAGWGMVQQVPPGSPRRLRLVKTTDGIRYEFVTELAVPAPSETTLRFDDNFTMHALIRCQAQPPQCWIGTASPPYSAWDLKRIDQAVGGPNMVALPNGEWLAGHRSYGEPFARTTLSRLDFNAGTLKPLLTLPSRGDNSYPGIVIDEARGEILVSYYSAHETPEPAIYLARLDLKAVLAPKKAE